MGSLLGTKCGPCQAQTSNCFAPVCLLTAPRDHSWNTEWWVRNDCFALGSIPLSEQENLIWSLIGFREQDRPDSGEQGGENTFRNWEEKGVCLGDHNPSSINPSLHWAQWAWPSTPGLCPLCKLENSACSTWRPATIPMHGRGTWQPALLLLGIARFLQHRRHWPFFVAFWGQLMDVKPNHCTHWRKEHVGKPGLWCRWLDLLESSARCHLWKETSHQREAPPPASVENLTFVSSAYRIQQNARERKLEEKMD